MPCCNNNNCNRVQNKLNKNGLCKTCNINEINKIGMSSSLSIDNEATNVNNIPEMDDIVERDVIDLLKEHMMQEKKRDAEVIDMLKEVICFLRNEIDNKNTIIIIS